MRERTFCWVTRVFADVCFLQVDRGKKVAIRSFLPCHGSVTSGGRSFGEHVGQTRAF